MYQALDAAIRIILHLSGPVWTPAGLDRELYPIAHLESSFGKKTDHQPNSKGEYWSSTGALGLKPVTAHEHYKYSPSLHRRYPGLDDQTVFTIELKTNPNFYNAVSTSYWRRLRKYFPNLSQVIYAWRFGLTKAESTSLNEINNHQYVLAYHELAFELQ